MIWKALALAGAALGVLGFYLALVGGWENAARLDQHERYAHRSHG